MVYVLSCINTFVYINSKNVCVCVCIYIYIYIYIAINLQGRFSDYQK